MSIQKVAIGLSGGVDSSVAAALLIEQGYNVTAVYITCWSAFTNRSGETGMGPCRSEADRKDALDTALQLNIPFVHLDFQAAYKEKVYEYMISEYQMGRTPNPDVMCNREIKFGLFYEWALEHGFDFVATGHYARISFTPDVKENSHPTSGVNSLIRSVDEHKDQTYFLYQLRQEQLEHILFPIGHLTKPQVREEAIRRNLLTAKKPDSQGVCFIGEVSVSKFLEERIEHKAGEIRYGDVEVGSHKGVWFYTVGQKIAGMDAKKLAQAGFDTTRLPHFYVLRKDIVKNVLNIGTKDQLYSSDIDLTDIHWIGKPPTSMMMTVRIRHTGELVEAELVRNHLTLRRPVWGVASGQMVVLYQDTVCLGGGVIV